MDKRQWQQKGAGHRQRLRDKFLTHGIDAFTNSDILELLLSFGTPRTDTKEPARAALQRWGGSLAAVLDADPKELQQIKGIGPKNVFALHFINGVARLYLQQQTQKRSYLTSSRTVADFLIHSMRHRQREVFIAIFLDAAHAVIDSDTIAQGTINCNTVYPRELVKKALAHNAAAVVVAHNHPSGAMEPSPQDLHLTRNLYLACALMNIRLLDHVIIGAEDAVYSFADHGIMATVADDCAGLVKARN